MRQFRLLQKLALASFVGVVSVTSFQGSAQAFRLFFGEDLGLGEATRLPSTPNANAAQASFLSNLSGAGTEDFEGIPVGTTTPFNITFPGSLTTNITATLDDSGFIENIPTGTNGFGRYPTSGDQLFNDVSSELDVFFDTEIAAFGFKGIDVGDFGGQIIANIKRGGTTIESITIPTTINAPGGGVLFFGIIAENSGELFDQIDFTDTAAGVDFFGYDDMTVGDLGQVQSPEPGTLLGILTVGGLSFALKRRNKQS